MTPEEYDEAVFLLGPWLVGCYMEVFLQGILICQFAHYISWYRDDHYRLKLTVAGLALLTILKSIQSFALIWIQLIDHFTDLDGAINLNYTFWLQTGNSLMVAVIGIYVQSYFCWRLYVISRKWWVVAPIAAILVFAFLSIILATYFITTEVNSKIAMWFAAHLSSVFAGDLLLSLTTVFFLLRSRKNVLPQTVGMISALIRLTFQSILPAAICAMLNLIFSQIYPGTSKIISTAFNQMLPKLYAISMMWTLNARRSIRAVYNSSGGPTSTGNADFNFSTRRSRYPRASERDNLELGSFGVRTDMETVQHIDMFKPVKSKLDDDHDTSMSSKKVDV